jgi:hypothetical protein
MDRLSCPLCLRDCGGVFANRNITFESLTPAGTVQGDGPQGTLTSQPFIIAGSRISFMLGGGCNERLEYVELIVDGDVMQRATGACSETMNRIIWDVSLYSGRSGQIRIVDASSGHWGHINVDDFRFDWGMQQYVESDRAGAAFVWRRKRVGSEEPCIVRSDMPAYLNPWAFSPLDCEYQFQQTLLVCCCLVCCCELCHPPGDCVRGLFAAQRQATWQPIWLLGCGRR